MANAHPRPRLRPPLAVLAALLATAGCQGGTGTFARWQMAHDGSIAKKLTKDELGNSKGLLSRWLTPQAPKSAGPDDKPGSTLVGGSDGWSKPRTVSNPEAEAELRAADALFQQGKLPEAEAAYAKIAKKHKGNPWGEKSQYYMAETRFQRGNYVGAHDSFELLHADYPGTQYLEKLVAREFDIATDWLDSVQPPTKPDSKDKGKDTNQAEADPKGAVVAKTVAKTDAKSPDPRTEDWKERFSGRYPLVDRSSHALAILEHVRHNDPTGPLEDDAVMRIADYHYEHENYDEAAVYYDQLIQNNPKSPFYQRAQLSSINAKMKNYLGPEYDGGGLDEARETIKLTMATTTERRAETNDALYNTLALIKDQQAERSFHEGEFWRKTGYVGAAEYSFGEILQRWPKSEWAKKAKIEMAQLAKMPRKEVLPSKIMTQPGAADPYAGGMGSASSSVGGSPLGGMSGAAMPTGP
ncbi:MAG: tetratricopeptide repeat protein [Isosphaeraceae bacterium]